MSKKKIVLYKVLEEFELDEVAYTIGQEVDLNSTKKEVQVLVSEGKIQGPEEEVDENNIATVISKNGIFVRSYSKEVHGKDFAKLANKYAGKIGGKVK